MLMCKIVKGPPVRFYLVFFSVGAKMIFKCLQTKKNAQWKTRIETNKSLINGSKGQKSEERLNSNT